MVDIQIFSDDVLRYQIRNRLHIDIRQIGFFNRNGDASAFQFFDVFGILQYAFPFDQHQVPLGKKGFRDRSPAGFGDDDVAGGEVVVGVEGFDGQLDDIGGAGYFDTASSKYSAGVIVDLDVIQIGGFTAGYEDARTVLVFDGCDAVWIEAAADEADLFSWDGQFWCGQHQVVFNQEIEFGVDFPESGDNGVGKAKELVLLAPGEVGDADVAHTQSFPHKNADDADVADDAGDG